MRAFILKILLFCALFLLGDQILTTILERFRPIDYRLFVESKSEILRKNASYDLLFIGDSHVSDAIDTHLVDSILHVRSFNLGVYHASPYEWFYLLQACLAHLKTKPQYLVIGTNPDMFFRERSPGKYTPVIIRDWFLLYSLYRNSSDGVDASFFVQSLRQSDLFAALKNDILGKPYRPTREIDAVYSGYLKTVNHAPTGNWDKDDLDNRVIEESQVEYLVKTIDLALDNGIKVLLVNEPVWRSLQTSRNSSEQFQAIQNRVKRITTDLNIAHFNADYAFGNAELDKGDYLNPSHLNFNGARKFSLAFSRWFLDNESRIKF